MTHELSPVFFLSATSHELPANPFLSPMTHELPAIFFLSPMTHELSPVFSLSPMTHELSPVFFLSATSHKLSPVFFLSPTSHELPAIFFLSPMTHELSPVFFLSATSSPNSISQALPRPDAMPSARSKPKKDLPDAVSPARRVMPPWGTICHSSQPCGRHPKRTNSAAEITFLKSILSNILPFRRSLRRPCVKYAL